MNHQHLTPQQALQKLINGNKRFAKGLRSIDSLASCQRREQLAREGQKPFAIVLTCADSRVPAETIFDAGLGELFVVRVAGNIVAPSLVASIEFAALTFGTPICVVVGHTRCGAIQGAVSGIMRKQNSITGNLDILLKEIEPAASEALASQPKLKAGDDQSLSLQAIVDHAIAINVQHSMAKILQSSPHLTELSKAGKFQVVGAVYDIATGVVDFGSLSDTTTSNTQKIDTSIPRV